MPGRSSSEKIASLDKSVISLGPLIHDRYPDEVMVKLDSNFKSWWSESLLDPSSRNSVNDGQISVFPVISVIYDALQFGNLFTISLSWRYGRTSVACEVLLRTQCKQIICSRIGFIIFDGSALFPSRWTLIHSNDNPYPFDIFFFLQIIRTASQHSF